MFASLLALLAVLLVPAPAVHHRAPAPSVSRSSAPSRTAGTSQTLPTASATGAPTVVTPVDPNPCDAVADTYAGDADPAGDPCGLGLSPVR